MRYESPDTQPDPSGAPLRTTVGPVIFSVVLHGVVLGLFARAAFAPEAEARIPDERRYVRVAMVVRQPRAPDVLPQPIEERVEPDLVEAPEETIPLSEPAAAADAEVASTNEQDEVERESTTGPAVRAWSPATLRAAIEAGTGDRQNGVIEAWVTDCILEQKEEGTRDCEEQQAEQDYYAESTRTGLDAGEGAFAGVTRPQQQAALVEQFEKENAVLASLAGMPGGAGALVRERYFLNREYILYLSGNDQDPMFAAMGNFSADSLGGPPLSLPGNIPFICKPQPCVYDFTGFEVERPTAEPEAGEFRVVPTLFGTRR